ncbi:MAG: clostripain-related cysteine peptidase [Methanoregula sp.]
MTGHLQNISERSTIQSKSICLDDTSRDFLDNFELKSALAIPKQKLDIIAFDACLMNMFEIIYQIKDITEIIIGSEETEPSAGWPYQPILNYMSSNQDVNNGELAKKIVTLYKESYPATGHNITQSATRTDSFEKAAKGLDVFAAILTEALKTIKPTIIDILTSMQRFGERDYIDLYDFVLLCQKNITQKSITDSAACLLTLLDEKIIINIIGGEDVKNAHGISVYFPLGNPKHDVLDMYRKLDFILKYPNWLRLITTYHKTPNVQR